MKISEQPTDHILVKALCQSEWDNCDFAIISCGGGWREEIRKRLEATRRLNDDDSLFSIKFCDGSAEFYVSTYDDIDEILSEMEHGNEWVFVELEQGEEDQFVTPESRLHLPMQNLYKNGTGTYTAHGNIGEEFYTESLPFVKILEAMSENQ